MVKEKINKAIIKEGKRNGFLFMCRNLVPVTQLYVSVDASTKDSLKKIDRPLFKDFWQRFLDSLRALGEKVSPLWQVF